MIRCMIIGLMVLMAAFAAPVRAQEFDASSFENYIEDAMDGSTIPGLAVVLFDGEGIFYEQAFGIANADEAPVTLDTPFQLGSVSKSFAALVMVQLADEGQVNLDTPVIEYLPYFRTRDEHASKDITVRQILSHRSGFATLDGNRIQDGTYRGADALTIAVTDLRRAKLQSMPGTDFEYSNANYMIAAAIIEVVTGETYETVMANRVFLPLGMTNSYVQVPMGESNRKAIGFRQWFGVSKAYPSVPGRAYVAAGGVVASAQDLAIYVNAISDRDPRVLPTAYADELLSRQGDEPYIEERWGYGLGWMIDEDDGKTLVYHSGLNGGYAAQVAFTAEDGRGGVVLTNQSGILQADVPGAVVRKGLDLEAVPSHLSAGPYIMIWSMAATALGLLFFFLFSTVRFTAYAKRVDRVNLFRRVAPSLALFSLAFVFAVIIPQMNKITLSGIRVFFPDLWLCLTASAVIAVVWGATRLVYPRK